MALWAIFALTGAATALLGVPVAPALFELRKRRDATPLPTSGHDGKITNSADAFSSRLEALRPRLGDCARQGQVICARIENTDVLLVGPQSFELAAKVTRGVTAVMCSNSVAILGDQAIDADVHAPHGVLRLLPNAALRAGISAEAVLEKNSSVLRWLHAGSVHMHPGSAAYGRLSAERFIHLHPGCVFEHMQSSQIHTIGQKDSHEQSGAVCHCSVPESKCHICEIELTHEQQTGDPYDTFSAYRKRIRHQGDFLLPAHQTLNANIIATGAVRFGPNSRFIGSTKSYKNTFVEEGACIHGSLTCGATLYLGERSSVTGPVMAEDDIVISAGAQVGRLGALTTIAARRVKIATGCQLHGTVWARVRGIIEN